MNKKTLLVLLPIILISCSNPSNTIDNVNTEKNLQPETVKPTQAVASAIPEEKIVKSYAMGDINNNFTFAAQMPSTYNFNGKINDKGNGIVILKSYAIKIANFKPAVERKLIDNNFSNSILDIDENGDGYVLWRPEYKAIPAATNDNSYTNEDYKCKKITNFDIADQTMDSNLCLSDKKRENTEKEKNLSKTLKQNESLRIDENGNGIIVKNYFSTNSFKILIVKNYNIENKEYSVGNYAANLTTQIDKSGRGFISWDKNHSAYTDGDRRNEIIIKKIENYNIIGEEISLGFDYLGDVASEIVLDKNGSGFITWNKQLPISFTRIRKINNYIPEDKAYELSINSPVDPSSITMRVNHYVLKNTYGDGLIIWDEYNYPENSTTNYYARAFENYKVSTQNLKEYLLAPNPKPTPNFIMPTPPEPISTPISSIDN